MSLATLRQIDGLEISKRGKTMCTPTPSPDDPRFEETIDDCAKSPLRSELARIRISYRSYQSHSNALSMRGTLMLMHVEDATLE